MERISRIEHISIPEAQKVFRQELVDYWDKWAMYDPLLEKKCRLNVPHLNKNKQQSFPSV